MSESRTIWLVTKDGVPHHGAWAEVKTQSEAPTGKKSHAAALGAHELLSEGWDATPTQWRNMPSLLYPDVLEAITAQVVGRDVIVAGLSYNLDQGGRPHPGNAPGALREPLKPDAVVVDDAALLGAVETLGRDLSFVERDTLKMFRVSADQGSTRADHEDVLLTRQDGNPSRSNKP